MDFSGLIDAVAQTSLSQALNHSTWDFPILQVVHLIALAALGGTVIVANLRVFGIGLRQPLRQVAAELRGWFLLSLTAILLSGVLMALSDPVRYCAYPTFRLKMLLLLVAIVATFVSRLYRQRHERITGAARALAALSLLSWFSVGLVGRLIGFL